jgi:hypothetical protein
MKLVLAAPVSGLPSLLMALVSQDCAIAPPMVKEVIRAARKMRFIISSIVCNGCNKLLCARFRCETSEIPQSSNQTAA